MDPYDDYDAQQYVYDESDLEQSDQDDDIVYLEGPVPGEDPFLPYLANDIEFSQSQSVEQERVVPTLLPRHERKRLRTEVAARMLNEGNSSSSESSTDDAREEQDAFASLQSLLEKQSHKVVDIRRNEESESCQPGEARETTQAAPFKSSTAEPDRSGNTDGVNDNAVFVAHSQPEFPQADDWELSQADPTQRTQRIITSVQHRVSDASVSAGLEKELRRQRKQKQFTPKPLNAISNVRPRSYDANLVSELEKNRKRARKAADWSKRRKIGGDVTEPGLLVRANSSQTPVANTDSIVGSR